MTIATETPTAFQVPKAGVSATLDARWLGLDATDTIQATPVEKSADFTAELDYVYIVTASCIVTDPTPASGHGFTVIIRNGTGTVGGTAYAVGGTVIRRIYHSGAWVSYSYPNLSGAWTWTAAQLFDNGSGTLPATIAANTLFRMAANDTDNNNIESLTWQSTAINFHARAAGGTRATPGATAANRQFFRFVASGHDGTSYQNSAGVFAAIAYSLWSGTNREVGFDFTGTPSGSTTSALWMRIRGGAVLVNNTAAIGGELLRITGGTSASPTSTDFVVGGGAAAAGATTASTSTGTGAITSAGGIGAAGQVTAATFATSVTTDSSTGTINALANPSGFIRLTGAAPDVRGLTNPGTVARRVVLYCVNATTLTHEAGTASASDRITSDTGANIAVAAGKTVELIYDPTSTRWRPVRF